MNHHEYMESIGQINIFDILPIKTTPVRNKAFVEGDRVKIRYYADEIEYMCECLPQLLEVGEIVSKQLDFYQVRIGDSVIDVPGEKLVLV